MKNWHRRACMLILLLALTGACGDDGDDGDDTRATTVGSRPTTVVTTTGTAPTTTTASAGRTTTSAPQRGVTDGAVCSLSGAMGVTNNGISMVCMPIAAGTELRWRPA